jgi:uncharacterized protein
MEDRDQTSQEQLAQYLQYTCPTCKRRVRVQRKDSMLPRFFPFCSRRCKLIDLGAWLDADYRISSKPDEESDHPTEPDTSADNVDSPQ